MALTRHATIFSAGKSLMEEVLALDDDLFAVATHPIDAPRRAVILLNAGAVALIGPNRLHVTLARRLAAAGDLVVRMDVSGIGDSRRREGSDENIVYSEHAVADVGVAINWAQRADVQDIAVVGLCSGAYHALKAALAGYPINTMVAINPLTFRYRIGMPLDFADFRVAADARRYQKLLTRGESWRKVLRGKVNLLRVAKVFAYRARDAISSLSRDALRRLHVPLKGDLGSELDALSRRSVALRFIFAVDDPGHKILVENGGLVVQRLMSNGRLKVRMIDGADHTFTARWLHPILLDAIAEALDK